MDKLARRGMRVDRMCPQCGDAPETIAHMALKCVGSKILWYISPLRKDTEGCMHSFIEWCEIFMKTSTTDRMWEIAMLIIWQAWNMRNKWFFEKKRDDPKAACTRIMNLLGEFEAATVREQPITGQIEQVISKWKPPVRTLYKLNTDASVTEGMVGLGMIVRDAVGDAMMSGGCRLVGNLAVLQVEAEGVRF